MVSNQDGQENAANELGRRKLKNLLLAPKSQFQTAIVIFALGFVFISVVVGNLLYRLNDLILTLADLSSDPVHAAAATSNTSMVLIFTYIFLLIGFLCSALYLAVTITHRYLGPMVPIQRHVKSLLEGDYRNRIHLRKQDEFRELAEDLNRLTERLHQASGQRLPEDR